MDKQETKIHVNLLLPYLLWEKAKIAAVRRHISLIELIRQAVRVYLEEAE